jgi:hypothetical protein
MKKSILNLDGVQALNRAQKQQVKGGRVDCSTVGPGSDPLFICCCFNIGCTKTLYYQCQFI